jgi:hypothetical protein
MCCLGSDELRRLGEDLSFVRDVERRLAQEIRAYGVSRFGRDWLVKAADDFDEPELASALFVPWSLFGSTVKGRPAAAWFSDERAPDLELAERTLLNAELAARVSIWEVTDVVPFEHVTVRDLFDGSERTVKERSASRSLVVRDTILARVVDIGAISVLGGLHPNPLPPRKGAELVRLAAAQRSVHDEAFQRELIFRWDEAIWSIDEEEQEAPRNADGEALLVTNDHYLFDDRASTREKLLEIPGTRADEDTIAFVRVTDETILGTARMYEGGFTVEANSLRRADHLRKKIAGACGDLVRHRLRDHADPAHLFPDAGLVHAHVPDAPPELRRAIAERELAAWLDRHIPALDGLTPREAVKTRRGRERVDNLLKDIENREAREPAASRADVGRARDVLRLR